ncbi:MAG: cation-translocating P-type ATPase [Oscillospiraceae bacterium]|nr:cation-translocating P-type ATPase [Oscillospiraceae bacterium]
MQKGLSEQKAAALLKEYGENLLISEKKESGAKIFFSQFKDLLTLILLCAAVVSVFMGEFIDAFTIMAIVFLNALIGFSQEYKTEKTLENLKAIAAPKATVYRDGVKKEIAASKIVPGDVVVLKSGSKVPGDGTILSAFGLFCDESMLTGESLPVEKKIYTGGSLTEIRPDCVYMGTSVTSGHGEFLVTETGMKTQMGKIADMLKESKKEQTPLQEKLSVLSRYIAIGCIVICAIVTVTGILRGEPVFDMFLTGLSLSVAAIPEGLTAVITISLGLAVSRMLKKNALIRKLHSVETLGCADVICSDKTGTLTENRMTVTEIFLPEGRKIPSDEFIKNRESMRFLLLSSGLCNNAEITGAHSVSGEPTEAALMKTVLDCGGFSAIGGKTFRRIGEIPFDSKRKLMSVLVKNTEGKELVFIKGAPDVLIPLCKKKLIKNEHSDLTDKDKNMIKAALSDMGKAALRVIALGYKEHGGGKIEEDNFVFLGLCGMIDPPRKGAAESVLKCKKAGIRTVMITGDSPETAFAIAKSLNIAAQSSEVITGKELDLLSDSDFSKILEQKNVFARVTPAHKLKIVKSLKKSGHIVAMTGDGVNDAPAVKEADIGVSMGKNGTDVTREASGLVLLDDDFSTLVSAAEEGRIIYGNIRKFIRYLLSCNIGEVVTMFFGMLMGMPVILLPIQILMVNLVTDGIPAIALSFDPPQDDVMLEKPRKRSESVFSGGLSGTIITRGIFIGLSVLGSFSAVLGLTGSVDFARTAAYLSLVFIQLIHVFECKSESRSLFKINLFNNMKLVFAVLLSAIIVLSTVYVPALASIFNTAALDLKSMLVVLGFTFAVPFVFGIIGLFKKR